MNLVFFHVISDKIKKEGTLAGYIRDEGSSGMVIVNDRLAREGDEVAPGVKLEKIVGDSLVFNYKGYRFKR